MRRSYIMIFTSMALAVVGCSSGPVAPKNEWRREVTSSQETKFPGVNYGMTEQEVRRKIPSAYTVMDKQKNIVSQTPALLSIREKEGVSTRFIRANRLHQEERILEVIHFVFVKGELKYAYAGYGSPLH